MDVNVAKNFKKGQFVKRPMLLVLAAGVALWLWLFAGVMFGHRNFAYRDAAHFYYPLYQLIQDEWGAGRIPLWNPYDNGGQPLLANPTASVLYPVKLIFALPIPYRLSYAAYILWHLLQALLAAAWVARSWGASRLAAALAGISYAFCGNVMFQHCNVVFLVGAAWLPFAWWYGERMLRCKSWPSAIGLGACLAMMVLGGDPQLAYVAGLSVSGYAAVLWWQDCLKLARKSPKKSSGSGAQRASGKKSGRQAVSAANFAQLRLTSSLWSMGSRGNLSLTKIVQSPLGLLVIAAVSAGLLCAVQVLPTEEFSRRSIRATAPVPRSVFELAGSVFASPPPQAPGGRQSSPPWYVGLLGKPPQTDQHHQVIYLFSVAPWRLMEYFFPNISGRMFPTFGRWLKGVGAEMTPWVPSLYMGLIPLMLALLALRWRPLPADDVITSAESAIDASSKDVVGKQVAILRMPAVVRWLSWLVLIFVIMSWGGFGPGWFLRCLLTGQVSPPVSQGKSLAAPVGDEFGGLYWFCTVVLPGFVQFRYPGKMLLPAALGLSWLGAMQFDRVMQEAATRQKFQRWMRRLALVSLIGTIGVLLLSFAWPTLTKNISGDEYVGKFDVWSSYTDLLTALIQTALLTCCCGWMRWPTAISDTNSVTVDAKATTSTSAGLVLVLLTIFDLGWSNGWMILTAPAEIWNAEPRCAALIAAAERDRESKLPLKGADIASATELAEPYRVFRISSWYPPEWKNATNPEHLSEGLSWEHDTLASKYNSNLRMEMINGSSTFDLGEISQILNPAYLPIDAKTVQYVQPRRGMDLWNVKYFLLPIHDNFTSIHETTLGLTNAWKEPRWSRMDPQGQPAGPPLANAVPDPPQYLANSPDVRVLYNPFCLPRAWIVHDIVGVPVLNSLSSPIATSLMQPLLFPVDTYLDPRQTVIIENDAIAGNRLTPQGDSQANLAEESVRVTRFEPNEVVLEGEMKSPGAVVLGDVFYPGWNAQLAKDGAAPEPETISRANFGMRGVMLPAGRFKLTFRYQPFWFYVGGLISATAWLTLIGGTLLMQRRRRQRSLRVTESS